MYGTMLQLFVKSRMLTNMLKEDHGQDLVEYAAVLSIILLGTTAGIDALANGVNSAMTTVSTKISNKLS